jgi:hypothetical protein
MRLDGAVTVSRVSHLPGCMNTRRNSKRGGLLDERVVGGLATLLILMRSSREYDVSGCCFFGFYVGERPSSFKLCTSRSKSKTKGFSIGKGLSLMVGTGDSNVGQGGDYRLMFIWPQDLKSG